ncbi:hypothetical protein Q8A67_025402 [Cirrhinus molitorella]|uniref:Uncharacterized protein n=1 Tax=Cirrhinus molitorella TaxID=172907 RepID=A0AA88THT1_9TELE|nr:hypothetical protein Q8A67_025402 [Cirrhinus molitorella]
MKGFTSVPKASVVRISSDAQHSHVRGKNDKEAKLGNFTLCPARRRNVKPTSVRQLRTCKWIFSKLITL